MEIDAYPRFREGTYAYVSGAFAPSPSLFPQYRFTGDLYQSLGAGFEASVGYRRMQFTNAVNIYVGSLTNYRRLGQLDEAAVLFAEGESLAADYLDFQTARGRLLLRRGKPIEAERLLRGLLNDTPDAPDAFFALGVALERQGRLADAEQVFESGLLQDPNYSGMSVALARLKLWAGEAEAAHRLATSELAQHPNDVDAMALERLNRLDQARAMAERVIERSPAYGDAYL